MVYKIIQTGSKGNALLLGDELLVDCGVSFKKLKDEKIRLVLLLTSIKITLTQLR